MYIAGVGTSKREGISPCIRKAFWRNLIVLLFVHFYHCPWYGWMDGWIGGCFDTLLEESVVIIFI